MKKNTIKAFTLVEMLIVIVIIGILIAALLPRMQAAQGRARDVARKTALSQVQSAIVTYQGDHGRWPGMAEADSPKASAWISLDAIEDELLSAWMTNVPVDPLEGTTVSWLIWGETMTATNYWYLVMTRNGTANAWFALMAKTEVAWWSNYVLCDGATLSAAGDLKDVTLCSNVEEGDSCSLSAWTCTYNSSEQLRYVVLY